MQQINLYPLLPEAPKLQMKMSLLAWCYGVFFCYLVLSYGQALWHQHQQSVLLKQTQQTLRHKDQELAALKLHYPLINPNDLSSSVAQLNQQLMMRGQLYAALEQRGGFSPLLTAVASAIPQTVWLTHMVLKYDGLPRAALQGNALQAEAIQEFLDHLKLESIFAETQFNLLEMTQANAKDYFTFYASNQIENAL